MNAALRRRLAPTPASQGGLTVCVMDRPVTLRPSGAIWLPEHRLLAAADLHLEKGSAFAVRGQMLPPYDTAATLERLAAEVEALDPAAVLLLGDSFHDTGAVPRLPEADLARLSDLADGRDWIWLEGNHDREALGADLDRLPGRTVGEMTVDGLTLTHEPLPGDRPGEVAGHLHPCVRVTGFGRSVRRPCFLTDGRRLILPAFGAFTGGLSVRDPAFVGLFDTPPLAVALGRDRLHPLRPDAVG